MASQGNEGAAGGGKQQRMEGTGDGNDVLSILSEMHASSLAAGSQDEEA